MLFTVADSNVGTGALGSGKVFVLNEKRIGVNSNLLAEEETLEETLPVSFPIVTGTIRPVYSVSSSN